MILKIIIGNGYSNDSMACILQEENDITTARACEVKQ